MEHSWLVGKNLVQNETIVGVVRTVRSLARRMPRAQPFSRTSATSKKNRYKHGELAQPLNDSAFRECSRPKIRLCNARFRALNNCLQGLGVAVTTLDATSNPEHCNPLSSFVVFYYNSSAFLLLFPRVMEHQVWFEGGLLSLLSNVL